MNKFGSSVRQQANIFYRCSNIYYCRLSILSLSSFLIERNQKRFYCTGKVWADIIKGTRLLFRDKAIRFALLIELVAATAGAQILANTMGYIKGRLQLTYKHYRYVMAAFDISAVIAVFAPGKFDKSKNRVSIFNDRRRFSKCFYCLLQLPHFYSSLYFMVDCRL